MSSGCSRLVTDLPPPDVVIGDEDFAVVDFPEHDGDIVEVTKASVAETKCDV